jgi:hypothetical protein
MPRRDRVEEQAFLSFFQPGASLEEAALMYASFGLHVLPLRSGSKEPATGKGGVHNASGKADQIKQWWGRTPSANIGIALRYSSVVVIDVDPRNRGDSTIANLTKRFGPLPPTFTVRTGGGGFHYYYRVDETFHDASGDFPSKLGDGLELLVNGFAVAPPSVIRGGGNYTIRRGSLEDEFAVFPHEWMAKVTSDIRLDRFATSWAPEDDEWTVEKGNRDNVLTSIAGHLRSKGANFDEIKNALEGFLWRFEDGQNLSSNVDRISRGMMNYPPGRIQYPDLHVTFRTRRKVPILEPDAYWGPIGSYVKYLEPYTETHPAALLIQCLTAFGNIIGPKQPGDMAPGFSVEDAWHRTALYVMLVGDSAKAGKGDSWSRVRTLLQLVDPTWTPVTGVQTGEGLINALVDDEPEEESTVIQGEKVQHVRKGSRRDRRYLVFEAEFGRALHVSSRPGSTLRDIYRELWDTGSSQKITAGVQQKVSDATVSLVGHITKPELERDFDPVDLLAGFGNRFLFCFTQRTKTLSSAPSISQEKLHQFSEPLAQALEYAQVAAPENYKFTKSAQSRWDSLSYELTRKDLSPIIDALTARARPIVRRLAVIFAVVDMDTRIDLCHLEAANAIWDYSRQTVEYIFGNYIGDKDANYVFQLLAENRAGLRMSDLYASNTNWKKARWERALKILMDRGLCSVRKGAGVRKKNLDIYYIPPDAL